MAASWCQPLHVRSLPRGARITRLPLIVDRTYPHESVQPPAQCRQTKNDRWLSEVRLLARSQTRVRRLFQLSTGADAPALPPRQAVRSPKDFLQDRQSTAV